MQKDIIKRKNNIIDFFRVKYLIPNLNINLFHKDNFITIIRAIFWSLRVFILPFGSSRFGWQSYAVEPRMRFAARPPSSVC